MTERAERIKQQLEGIRPVERALMVSPKTQAHINEIQERSYLRHVLARHIQTNNYARIRELRQKHGM